MAVLSRSLLQHLATEKVNDARLLFEHERYSNSYYLYGYGIELGLKACVSRQIIAETIPERTVLTRFLTHKLSDLVGLAGLNERLQERRRDRGLRYQVGCRRRVVGGNQGMR